MKCLLVKSKLETFKFCNYKFAYMLELPEEYKYVFSDWIYYEVLKDKVNGNREKGFFMFYNNI